METEIINIPANVSEYRIKHFKGVEMYHNIEDLDYVKLKTKLEICQELTGVPLSELRKYTLQSINDLFNTITQSLSRYKQRPVPTEVKYGDQIYTFIAQDFGKVPVGWVIDVSVSDFKKYPSKMAAMCYIEKGMAYGETDANGNITNPNDARMEVFEANMPLDRFIDLSGFFLKVSEQLTLFSMGSERQKRMEIKKMMKDFERLNGKLQSMRSQKSTESKTKRLKSGT